MNDEAIRRELIQRIQETGGYGTKKGAASNNWIGHVKLYMATNGVSYKTALQKSKETYTKKTMAGPIRAMTEPAVPVKRQRGRPRKVPIVALPVVFPVKRGRPRKVPIRAMTEPAVPVKRQRGRPRKVAVVEVPVDEVSVKKQRGRPKKTKYVPFVF